MATELDRRFFESTRGRIVLLMRGRKKTVNELAAELELTDNAVRAHLLSLERDGLIRQSGVQRGTRKPHFSYELTSDAQRLFPKAYDSILNQLITVLKGRLTPIALGRALRDVGRSLAHAHIGGAPAGNLNSRLNNALSTLEDIGGKARIEKDGDKYVIIGDGCPLASVVSEHPEVCRLAETLMSEVTGEKVQEQCDREGLPRCRFVVTPQRQS
jgi:predicted ArsR family transcriptional regulator